MESILQKLPIAYCEIWNEKYPPRRRITRVAWTVRGVRLQATLQIGTSMRSNVTGVIPLELFRTCTYYIKYGILAYSRSGENDG
jgi:hypothetical protein